MGLIFTYCFVFIFYHLTLFGTISPLTLSVLLKCHLLWLYNIPLYGYTIFVQPILLAIWVVPIFYFVLYK